MVFVSGEQLQWFEASLSGKKVGNATLAGNLFI